MTSVLDAWRAVDPEARLVSGSPELLGRPLRGVERTRAAPPHLPPMTPGQLLVADAAVAGDGIDALVHAMDAAGLEPSAIWIVAERERAFDAGGSPLPVIAGIGTPTRTVDAITSYLDRERELLAAVAGEVRLAGAEAALADPQPGAPAGVLATRLRRGVAVTVDGAFAALNPRPAGTALATRFAATYARLLGDRSSRPAEPRRTRDGLWVLERSVGTVGLRVALRRSGVRGRRRRCPRGLRGHPARAAAPAVGALRRTANACAPPAEHRGPDARHAPGRGASQRADRPGRSQPRGASEHRPVSAAAGVRRAGGGPTASG